MSKEPDLKKAPQNIDAEIALLGCCLLRQSAFNEVCNKLEPEDFYKDAHKIIWRELCCLTVEKPEVTPDIVSLTQHLLEKGLLQETGGPAYIAGLTNDAITSGNVSYYADVIKDTANRRRTWELGAQLCEKALNETEPLTDTLSNTANYIDNISKNNSGERYKITSGIKDFEELLKVTAENAEKPPISTGFYQLDNLLGGKGLKSGLYVLGAPSSAGKTSFALQLMCNIAEQKQDVLYFCYEQGAQELTAKCLSYLIGKFAYDNGYDINNFGNILTQRDIQQGKTIVQGEYTDYNRTQIDGFIKAVEYYKNKILPHVSFIEPRTALTASDIRFIAERHNRTTGKAPFLIIDYLQLVSAPESKNRLQDKQIADMNITALRQTGRDLKTAVIAISSIPRNTYNHRLDMSCFKESGSIEFSCDVAIVLQFKVVNDNVSKEGASAEDVKRAKDTLTRQMQLSILKDRAGKGAGDVNINFHPHCNLFIEL